MENPKISIVTVNIDEPLLELTCESIVNQTFRDYEWIIIDGGSTREKTVAALEKYKKYATYFVSEPNGGLFDAMNRGIAVAKGQWLIFMNAGDCFYESQSLEKMMPHIEKNIDCAVVYGGTLFESCGKQWLNFVKQNALGNIFFLANSIPQHASFIRRDMFAKYGHYRCDLRVVSDWAKFAQMYWTGEKFKSVHIPVAKYNVASVYSTLPSSTVYGEHAKIWSEYQPWVFESNRLAYYKFSYSLLRSVFFFSRKLRNYFREKRNQIRQIQRSAKAYRQQFTREKMLFVDILFHKKTRSVDFLLNLMKKHFDCDVLYHDTASDREFNIEKDVLSKYKYIVFFQTLPKWKNLRKYHNKNIFYFPMEEIATMHKWALHRLCKKLKFINFTKIGHRRVSEMGGQSLAVRFFVKPAEFTPGNNDRVFFWQRANDINIRNVLEVLPRDREFSIHLHTAVDPYYLFVWPQMDEEKKYAITYSDWFPDKSDLVEKIKEHGIFIAPRKSEGIGMSFLEAMAMGKAVIAHDSSTMNEYIENNVNGYIVDFDNPEPVDLSNIEWIRKNAYETAQLGYARWQNDEKKILKFIKGELKNE
ncbi:MAG: glycosyltransferase [Rickettsiales bacterium]|jgi:glycosyltransferase involved in cell wall biosynthesis|nr:glycosyltransferase [Rickettsiales bacterium]